jgi:hypothetical protein
MVTVGTKGKGHHQVEPLKLRSEIIKDTLIIHIRQSRNDLKATRDFLSYTIDSLNATKRDKINIMDFLLANQGLRRGNKVFSWAEQKASAKFSLPPDDIDYTSHVRSVEAHEKQLKMGCDVRFPRVLLMEEDEDSSWTEDGRWTMDDGIVEDLQGNSHEPTMVVAAGDIKG